MKALPQMAADTMDQFAREAYRVRLGMYDIGGRVALADDPGEFTCRACSENASCDYAFDLYNTNGDCLASK